MPFWHTASDDLTHPDRFARFFLLSRLVTTLHQRSAGKAKWVAAILAGSKTTENHFHFSNAIMRTGFARDIPVDTLRGALRSIRLEGGLALRSISYTLDQTDHVASTAREQRESWVEWTRTWGVGLHFSDMMIRYVGRTTTGTGRPGVFSNSDQVFAPAPVAANAGGSNFISAPSGATTLTGVAVTTHQVSVSIPIR